MPDEIYYAAKHWSLVRW